MVEEERFRQAYYTAFVDVSFENQGVFSRTEVFQKMREVEPELAEKGLAAHADRPEEYFALCEDGVSYLRIDSSTGRLT